MKKDRNCMGNVPYPIYQPYGGVMPINQGVIPMPINQGMMSQGMSQGVSIEQQINNMSNQINSLERRVSALETTIGNAGSKYNNSNYQMM